MVKWKINIDTDTPNSYGVECLLRLKGVQVTQIIEKKDLVFHDRVKTLSHYWKNAFELYKEVLITLRFEVDTKLSEMGFIVFDMDDLLWLSN